MSEKGIILYRSKYGATKKYAQWLAESTGYECVETREAAADRAAKCERIVLCGGIYASGIAGLSFLKKNIGRLQGRKVFVFCVGASPFDEGALEEIRRRNLKGPLRDIPLFYGRGMWDESRMTFRDRTLCRLLQKSLERRDPDTCEPWMKALLASAGQACDWTDRSFLTPLEESLKP